jgi:putative inorganic carbon (hco3(-)) transporter
MSRSQRRRSTIFTQPDSISNPGSGLSSGSGSGKTMAQSAQTAHKKYQDYFQLLIVFLFQALFFATPLLFTWVNEELFEFNKMIFTYGITFLILGAWIARMVFQERIFLRKTPFDIFILLFFSSQVLSTIFSTHPYTSFFGYYTRFHGGLLSTFCYITLFYALVSNVERKHLSSLFASIFGSSFLVMLMAIPEHFGRSFSCLLIGASQDHAKNGWSAVLNWSNTFSHYNVTCWIQDVQDRVFASFGQPNWLAAYAITLIPISAIFSLSPEEDNESQGSIFPSSLLSRAIYGGLTVLLFATLLFTKSRSGIAGLFCGILYFAFLCIIFWIKNKKIAVNLNKTSKVASGILVIGLIALALFFGTPYTPNFGERLLQKNSTGVETAAAPANPAVNRLDVGGTDSGEIRKIVWDGAIKVGLRYPIFGSGVETFAYSYYKDRPLAHNLVSEWDFLYNKAHNEFLNFWATTGAVGLISYLLLLTAFSGGPVAVILFPSATKNILRRIPLAKKFATDEFFSQFTVPNQFSSFLFSAALSTGLIALSVSNFFGFSTVMVTILLFLYPAFFVVTMAKDSNWFTFSLPNLDPTTRRVTYSLTIGIIFILLYWVFNMWQADKLFALGKSYNQAGQLQQAVSYLQQASTLEPSEATFTDELSLAYARLAIAVLDSSQDATAASQIAQRAIATSDQTMELNPVHLNFYKTRVRVLLTLAPYRPSFLTEAVKTLQTARELSPTDPKLLYNLALIQLTQPQLASEGMRNLEKVIQMKPNYEAARMSLADAYQKEGQTQKALENYKYVLTNIQPNNITAQTKIKEIESGNSASTSASQQDKTATPSGRKYNTP